MKEDEIKNTLKEFIRSEVPFSYYIGIAKNSNVNLEAHFALHTKAVSIEVDTIVTARNVERYFINVIGMDGGAGVVDNDSKFIYCYKKDNKTIESI